jgi:hypothetical protein
MPKLPTRARHLARAIREAQALNPWPTGAEATAARLMRETIARNVGHTLAIDEPHFDIPAFLRECGLSQ